MEKDLGKEIHRVILNEPVKVRFTDKKGKVVRTFKIGLLSLSEAVQISRIAYGTQVKKEVGVAEMHELISLQSDKLIEVITIMLKSRSRLPKWYIKRIINKYSNPNDLEGLISLVYDSMAVKSFLNSIILLSGMSLIKQEEIIASREQLKKTRLKEETA